MVWTVPSHREKAEDGEFCDLHRWVCSFPIAGGRVTFGNPPPDGPSALLTFGSETQRALVVGSRLLTLLCNRLPTCRWR